MTKTTRQVSDPRVSMIGNAHIDPVWIWDWHEGMGEVLHTFASALDRLREDPDFTFCASSSAFYEWVEKVDPLLFVRIQEAVASKRWVLVGGQWVEPDCNIPTGESVARQLLYGQRYLSSRFGATARVGWNIDAFGHAGGLPQIFAAGGLSSYVMMRPDENEKEIPSPLFSWLGCDGTKLVTYRIPFHYGTDIFEEDTQLRQRTAELSRRAEDLGVPLMLFFGVGNHGGGPTREALRVIREISGEEAGSVCHQSPEDYFARVSTIELPTVTGEIQWHAVGCYSARAEVKRRHSACEQALLVAEKAERICKLATGEDLLDAEGLRDAWKSLLFSQFHDALGGTCSDHSNEGIDLMVEQALAVADRVTTLALHKLSRHIDTWTKGAERAEGLQASALGGLPIPVLVINPLSWEIKAVIKVPYPFASCTDDAGQKLPIQQVPSHEVTFGPTATLVQVPLLPMGFRQFWLHAGGKARLSTVDDPSATTNDDGSTYLLSNGAVRVEVDGQRGAISKLEDKRGQEWLRPEGIHCVVIDDPSDTWSHGVSHYGGPEYDWDHQGIEVVENGPVRSMVREHFTFAQSTLTWEISLYRGESFLDLAITIDWRGRHQLVKVIVPLAIDDARCVAGAPYGAVNRTANGHEDSMIHWVDVSKDGRGGVTTTSIGSYGYDFDGGRLRLTLLRSPRVADHNMGWGGDDPIGYPYTDQGIHKFHIRIHPHDGSWQDATAVRRSEEHHLVPPMVLDTWHRGSLGSSSSLLQITKGTAVISAVKRAECGSGTVVRIWESTGRKTRAALSVISRPNLFEVDLTPFQLMTVFVPDDPSCPLRLIDLCEFTADISKAQAQ